MASVSDVFADIVGQDRAVAMLRGLADPAVKKRLNDDGAEPTPNATPEEFGAFIKSEMAKWGKLIKDAGIKGE